VGAAMRAPQLDVLTVLHGCTVHSSCLQQCCQSVFPNILPHGITGRCEALSTVLLGSLIHAHFATTVCVAHVTCQRPLGWVPVWVWSKSSMPCGFNTCLIRMHTCRVVVVEGNYVLLDIEPWHQLKAIFDDTWFVDVPLDEAMERVFK
jgi:hypothetical protein